MEDSSFKFGVIRATSMEKSNILTISELCEIAGVSRSGYYAWLSSEQKRAAREAQDAADFQQILEAYRFRGYAKGVRGIHMRLLHTGIRMNGKKIRRLMKKFGLDRFFRFYLDCTEAGAHKEKPDIYLQAAERLGAAPSECVVVEDSAYCAETAHNAGFYVVGVYDENTAPRGDVSQFSDVFIRSLTEFPEL